MARLRLLRFMYGYTVIVCGILGGASALVPQRLSVALGLPPQDPHMFALVSSIFLAFAIAAGLGLWAPLRFAPVLLLQLLFKVIWILTFVFPHVVGGDFPAEAIPDLILFATFILGDLFALPFSYIFAGSEK